LFRQKMQRLRIIVLVFTVFLSGCEALTGTNKTGVVIARRAQIRSSTAIVAAELLDVVRGDRLTILDEMTAENSERWLRVRASDPEQTEGWIEARNVMPEEMLARSRRLAEEDRDIPAQATGQLRASANLRLAPDRTASDNILMKLESGARFEIVDWRRVPKPRTNEENATRDDAPRTGTAGQQNNRRRRGQGAQTAPEAPQETTELWYRVRLPSSVSPAPAGWVFGQQVELQVPSDIIFYRTGREFVAWRRLDQEQNAGETPLESRDAAAREAEPGSWVILEKSSIPNPNSPGEFDFDRIFVLGYDRGRREHYSVYRSPDVRGRLPLRVETRGDTKVAIIRIQSGEETREVRLNIHRNENGTLRVEVDGQLQ
jgi:hypothetical protein